MTIYTRPEMFIDTTPTFAQNIAGSLGTLVGKAGNAYINDQKKLQREKLLRNALEQQGITGALQDLYIYGTEGGRTDITKNITEAARRNSYTPLSEQEKSLESDDLIQQYERNNFSNLTDREKTIFRRDTRKFNQNYFKSSLQNYNNLQAQDRDLRVLQKLNDSDKLPSGLMRLNVDNETGALKLPFLASKESQQYVKTLNRFFDGLKDTFGARITNLDVTLYSQRLPTLANSQEARRAILQQMQIVNQINKIYYSKVRELYTQYGDRLTEAQIETIAEKDTKSKIDALNQQYQELDAQINQIVPEEIESSSSDLLNELPDPATEKGNILEDETTGQRYQSDGNKWIKVQ